MELLPVIGGCRRALGAPGLILAAWLLTVLAALPATVALRYSLQESFGRTLAGEKMADGFDTGWYGDYRSEARGIERSFDPTAAGVGGVLSNLEGWADGSLVKQPPALIGLAVVFVLAWALFLGGAIERYAFADAPRGVAGALAAGGRYWMRFVRLSVLSSAAYYGVYRLHQWTMSRLEASLIDVTEETRAMWATLAVYAATALLLVAVRACFDYAKIAIVTEDRKSALISALRGFAFVMTHPLRAMGLVFAIALPAAAALALYLQFRPSTATPGWSAVVYAVVLGQSWIAARLTLRLALLAGQTALYQSASKGPRSSAGRGRGGPAVTRLPASVLVVALGCAPSAPVETLEPMFVDVTAEAGLDYAFDRARGGGYFMPDSLASGVAFIDFDLDGDLDVYVVLGVFEDGRAHADGANRLFRQESDGRFTDISAASGAADPGYGMGVAVGDIDNDGYPDLFVTNYGPDALLHNNGDGTFVDATERAGVGDPRWGASAGFFDFDNDGFLDLFVTHYVQFEPGPDVRDSAGQPEYPGPDCCPGTADTLYRNNGDGTFADISREVGIADDLGKGLGVGFADFDSDFRVDVFVANDGEANRAWVRDGSAGLRDVGDTLGVALNAYGGAEASMGVVIADLDGDARADVFLTHLFQETNTLYLRGDGGQFVDATLGSGLGKPSIDRTGFGAVAVDVDLDGRPELAVANGRVLRANAGAGHWGPYAEPNLLFWNEGAGRFVQAGAECGTFCDDVGVSRGLAAGDVDNDGDADLLLTSGDGRLHLYRNVRPRDAHWLGLQLIDAPGTVVTVRVGGRVLRGAVGPASSYLSSNDPRVLFGLGADDQVDEVRVTWPDGTVEVFDGLAPDRYHALVRGEGHSG